MSSSRTNIPLNVLTRIYNFANARTKTRLRATGRAAARDPLMPPPSVGKGFAFGTGGKYQKLYNQLPQRFRAIRNKLQHFGVWYKAETQPLMSSFHFFNKSLRAYKKAVKEGVGHVQLSVGQRSAGLWGADALHFWHLFPKLISATFTNAGRQKASSGMQGNLNLRQPTHAIALWEWSEFVRQQQAARVAWSFTFTFTHPDREAFMRAVLPYVDGILRDFEARNFGPWTNANASRAAQADRQQLKNVRVHNLQEIGHYNSPSRRTAARLNRREQRRQAAAA